jgi:hypothetical protein
LQFVGILDVALHENRKAEHSSVVIRQAHNDVPQLLFGPKVVEGWLLHEGKSQVLQYLSLQTGGLVLVMYY